MNVLATQQVGTAIAVALILLAYSQAHRLSRSARRRREARALHRILQEEIRSGRRTAGEPAVRQVLNWTARVWRQDRPGAAYPQICAFRVPPH